MPAPWEKYGSKDVSKSGSNNVSSDGGNKPSMAQSSYQGVPDADLSFLQKVERGAQNMGFIKPGMELFSPAAMENKKAAAPFVAGTLAAGAGAVAAGPAVAATATNPLLRRAAIHVAKQLPYVGGGGYAVYRALKND